jgi:hypothetical protein
MTKPPPFGCDVRNASAEQRKEFLRLLNEYEKSGIFCTGKWKFYGIKENSAVDAFDSVLIAEKYFTRIIPIEQGIAILKGEEEKENDVRELLSEYAHNAWSGWMKYLFEKSTINDDGTCTIPKWAVEKWVRQSETLYELLPEEEKNSDRKEADEMLKIFNCNPPKQ